MKSTSGKLLGLSFILNVVLAIVITRLAARTVPPVINAAFEAHQHLAHQHLAHQSLAMAPIPVSNTNESSRSWIEQLRTAGVSDKLLARLVAANFDMNWEQRRRDLQRRYNEGDVDDDALAQFEQQFNDEKEKAMRAALGEEGFRAWNRDNILNDFSLTNLKLTGAEADALYGFQSDLARKQRELEQSHRDGKIDDADFTDQQTALQSAYEDQFKGLVGNDRYADLLSSDGAAEGALSRSLKSLNATDAQMEAVLAAQREWEKKRAELDGQDDGEEQRALDAARDEACQRALGADGFDQLQKAGDGNYQTLERYANVWQLSDSDVDYVYRSLQNYQNSVSEYQQRAEALEAQGASVDWDKVQENLQQFAQQIQGSLRTYLGEERFQKLQRNELFNFAN